MPRLKVALRMPPPDKAKPTVSLANTSRRSRRIASSSEAFSGGPSFRTQAARGYSCPSRRRTRSLISSVITFEKEAAASSNPSRRLGSVEVLIALLGSLWKRISWVSKRFRAKYLQLALLLTAFTGRWPLYLGACAQGRGVGRRR